MKIRIFIQFLLLQLFFFTSHAQIISQWRGVDRKGVYSESGLLESWPTGGPKLKWVTDSIGNGYGSPAVTSDRIYITGEKDSIGYLSCYNLQGTLLWKSEYGREWTRSFQGSRSTPTVTPDLVYVCSGLGNITCFETKQGTKKWSVNMIKDLHGRSTFHGHSESPLIDGDRIFLVAGGVDTNVVALNRFTGKINWICKGKSQVPGYNSPYLITLPSRKIVVTFSAYDMMGIDASTGELLWTHEQDNYPPEEHKPGIGDTHSNTIWYENGFIYYIAGDGNCAVKLSLSADGRQISQVWRNKEIDNFMGGFIKIDSLIYSTSNFLRQLLSINANTGEVTDSIKCGIGALISDGKLLYYYNQKGQVFLINPNPKDFKVISSFAITKGSKEHFSHPVIDKGVLYIRHGRSLLAYQIKEN
jgi:outer membrane protein assembly factor BamB